MLVIGLTGGIGTGKSEVSKLLNALGAKVIDADNVAHETYKYGKDGWCAIVATFGKDVLSKDGEVDRGKLADLVFNNLQALTTLNEIVHPITRSAVEERLDGFRRGGEPVVVVEAPLLIEAGWAPLFDEIWVTMASDDQVVARVAERSRLDSVAIRARISSQMSQDERRGYAHVIIDNNGTLDDLDQRVNEFWRVRVVTS